MATAAKTDFDAVVVGAGFGGLVTLYRLRERGFRTRVFEAGSGIGGTWFWNRYPGARCDIESMEYSYQFSEQLQQEWEWSERYATQPEILRYIEHVADRFDLRRDVQLDTRVRAAHWNEERGCWQIETEQEADSRVGRRAASRRRAKAGPSRRGAVTARFLSWRPAACRRRTCPTFPAATRSRARPITPDAGRTAASTSRDSASR